MLRLVQIASATRKAAKGEPLSTRLARLSTLIGALLLVSTALGSTAAASYPKTRVRGLDEKSQQFGIERSAATAGDVSGKVALTDGSEIPKDALRELARK